MYVLPINIYADIIIITHHKLYNILNLNTSIIENFNSNKQNIYEIIMYTYVESPLPCIFNPILILLMLFLYWIL